MPIENLQVSPMCEIMGQDGSITLRTQSPTAPYGGPKSFGNIVFDMIIFSLHVSIAIIAYCMACMNAPAQGRRISVSSFTRS
jgi:hypothetical protein